MEQEALDAWVRRLAARHGARPDAEVCWLPSVRSGARVALVGDVAVKVHRPDTDGTALAARLALAASPALEGVVVAPLHPEPVPSPAGPATAWPRVGVLHPADDESGVPWAAAGTLLARLHRVAPPPGTPRQGGPARIARALRRATAASSGSAASDDTGPTSREDWRLLAGLAQRLLDEVHEAGRRGPVALVHGDWHLGQLAWLDGTEASGLRLLDLDDLGVGDPAWDLGRPSGFWACGLVGDAAWGGLLEAYRSAGGPGVPPTGNPWPRLELAARCAVLVAAVREARVQPAHSADPAGSLLEACRRM